jgi:hypothetical protein
MRARASAASRPEFAIQWRGITELLPEIATGMTEEQARLAHRHDRPLLVYVYPEAAQGEDEDPRVAVEEDAAFRDEGVVVGARFFDCVRIHQQDAREDRALKAFAGSAPCLVFVRPDFTPTKSLRGRFNAKSIVPAMGATLEADYANSLRKTMKEQEKLEGELVKVYQRQSELAAMDGKIADEKCATKRKELQGKRDVLAGEIRTAEDALRAQEKALYELKPKAPA